MAKQTSLYITDTIKNPSAQITNASGTTAVQLAIGASNYTVGADDGVLKSLTLVSTDSSVRYVQVILNDGTNDRVLGTVPVAALAGSDGTVAGVDALSKTWLPGLPLDQNGKPVVPLAGGYAIKLKMVATLTSAKTIDALAVIEEY